MTQLSQDVSALWNCLFGTVLPFGISSFAVEIVAVSFATLETNSKLKRWLQFPIFCHLVPLLIAPILFANVLTTYVENRPGWIEWSQSVEFAALFGFLFHSFLAYVVVTKVFTWETRVNRARRFAFNNPGWKVKASIYLLEIGPPICFTWAMVFVFHESMISVPFFTGRPTVLSYTQNILQGSSSIWYSLGLAFSLITIASLFLALSFQVPRKLAVRTLSHLALAIRPIASVHKYQEYRRPSRIIPILAGVVVSISLALHAVIIGVVLSQLFRLTTGGHILETGPAWETLVSPAVICGCVVLVVWIVKELRSTTRRFDRSFKPFRSVALVPPSLIGTVGLLLVFGWVSQYFVAYGLLLAYSYFLLRFFVNDSDLATDRLLLHNAKTLSLRFHRRLTVVLLTAIGGILWPALWAFYFLWIEDGVQVSILTNTRTLASVVRGLKQDKLLPGTYLGLIGCFAAWLTLSAMVKAVSHFRYRFLGRKARRTLLSTFAVVVSLFSLTGISLAQPRPAVSSSRISCTQEKISIAAGGAYTPPCADVRINEMVLEGNTGSFNVTSDDAEVEIAKLTLVRGGATLHFNGVVGKRIRELLVKSVVLQGVAATEVAQLDFDNASIGRLLVSGLNLEERSRSTSVSQPVVNLFMKDSSYAEIIDIHQLVCPELTLRVGGDGPDSVHFERLSTGSVKISSAQKDPTNTSIEGDVRLETRPGQQPEFNIDSIRLRNLQLNLEGSAGLNLILTSLKTDPQTNCNLQINSESGVVNIRVEDLTLGGRFKIEGTRTPAEYRITMYAIGRASRFPNPAVSVGLNVVNLSRFTLKQIDVDELVLCGTRAVENLRDYLQVQDLSVTGEAVVPREMVEVLSDGSSALSRLRLLKMLQEHGRFCGSTEPIGVQALYSRKRAELLTVHPIAGWIIDQMTGLGVQIRKAFVTFFVVLVLYFLGRGLLLSWSQKLRRRGSKSSSPRAFINELFFENLFDSNPQNHKPGIQKALRVWRLIFGWFVFIQITLCSIYLSQTTLQ